MKTPLDVYAITRHFVADNAGILGSELVNRVLGLCRARDFQALASITDNLDLEFREAQQVKVLLQIQSFFKKNADFADEDLCIDNALGSFNRAEKLCRITNRRLDYYYGRSDRLDPEFALLIEKAQSFISEVLGDYHLFQAEIPLRLKVTSGATYSLARRHALPPARFLRRIDVSPRCEPYLSSVYILYGYRRPQVDKTLWNRVEFVPKNWKTHRSIACEPTGNIPFQLAFDSYVKERLRPCGINLSDQSRNQRHAKEGSECGTYCTIDLSMASDTLAFNTVAYLIPIEWFRFLSDVRSPLYVLGSDTRPKRYAKFSSMGNGSTFALETLIFASLVRAAGSRKGLVYGDDITIEPEYAANLFKLLSFFGFLVNKEKSYTSGPFRESCGKYYFRGQDVTPFFIRSTGKWDRPNACHNVNGLRSVANVYSEDGKEISQVWSYLLDFVEEHNLPFSAVSEDTMSGIHIHPFFAYSSGIINDSGVVRARKGKCKNRSGILVTKSYVRKGKLIEFWDSRALAMWHLRALQRSLELCASTRVALDHISLRRVDSDPMQPVETSRYTASSTKYVRKWVTWQVPSQGLSETLFAFSQLLFRKKS